MVNFGNIFIISAKCIMTLNNSTLNYCILKVHHQVFTKQIDHELLNYDYHNTNKKFGMLSS